MLPPTAQHVHLRDAHSRGAEKLGHGQGYQYAHDSAGGVAAQDYLGVDRTYYEPTDRGYEKKIAERIAWWEERRAAAEPQEPHRP